MMLLLQLILVCPHGLSLLAKIQLQKLMDGLQARKVFSFFFYYEFQ